MAEGYTFDDTPKAFARLMHRQAKDYATKLRSGLDNGEARSKKRKRSANDDGKQAKAPKPAPPQSKIQPVETPTIRPGEKLRDFNARVDQALPVSGLARKGNNKGPGPKDRQTKTEKRMHKMYADWRKEDERIKEKAEEEQEDREEQEEEYKAEHGEENAFSTLGKKGRRMRMIGEDKDKDDPWSELEKRRNAPKGLHDIAQAPPELTVKPKEKFKVKNNARVNVTDVPNAAGSLKRREELGTERQNIIDSYRALMRKRDGSED